MRKNLISDGIHYLSGIGSVQFTDENSINYNEIEGNLFEIDGVTYLAYLDPDDGWRSYGVMQPTTQYKCQYTFPPQKVIVTNRHIEEELTDDWGYNEQVKRDFLIIKDAILNKEVLAVGTDYSEDYYPVAIFRYSPMNLYANVVKDMK